MYLTKSILLVLVAFYLAAAQAATVARKSIQSKDTVELTNNGISLKSGYEGYLRTNNGLVANGSWFSASQIDVFKALIMYKSSFLPQIGFKIIKVISNLALLVFFGMASTALICTFSPLCNISFDGSKPSIFAKKEILPQLKEAYAAVSRIPNLLKSQQSPTELQPEEPLAVAESAAVETLEQAIDPRNPQKNLHETSSEENIDSRNSQKSTDEQTQTLNLQTKKITESEA